MNPIPWLFFFGTVGVSLGLALYGLWVSGKYAMPQHSSGITGCEAARTVLDSMGVIHISVTPVEPPHSPEDYLASEGLFLERRIYEGRDVRSLVLAARQAFLKGQLSNITFWVHLKKQMAFAIRLAVTFGWLCLLAAVFVRGLQFLGNLGLGAFVVVMVLAFFDLPFELEVEEKTSAILKGTGGLAPHEFMCFKKINQAVSFAGLACLIRAPFDALRPFFKRNSPR